MAEKKKSVIYSDLFIEGALRSRRKDAGTQKEVGALIGVSAGTISRGENGRKINFTSALLEATFLGIIPPGEYNLNKPSVQAQILQYMRVTDNGRHAKGWEEYCTRGFKQLAMDLAA